MTDYYYPMPIIDLRSDTVSWPTAAMREAMAKAEVGDDVFKEDPTVNRLQTMAAEITGHEDALLVTSGTQGNLIGMLTHCGRGDEMILGAAAHTFKYEVGGAAALGGIHPHPVPIQPDGTLALEDIRQAIRYEDVHLPPTRLVTIENTNGAAGGQPLSVDYTRSVAELCVDYGLKLHIDGARIFNAAAALGCQVKDLTQPADSVSFCLSKGLCAPAGAILCGSHEFISRARKIRKMVGGGMRQAGVLAAAGIVGIQEVAPRFREDHANAKRLAEGLAQIDGIEIDLSRVKTNMVFFALSSHLPLDANKLYQILDQDYQIRLSVRGSRAFRAVTHYWIRPQHIETTIDAIEEVLRKYS